MSKLCTIFEGQRQSNVAEPNLNVGDIVQIKKANDRTLFWGINNIVYGQVIGKTAERYLLQGSEAITADDIAQLPDEFEATVVSVGTVNMGQNKPAWIINIPMPDDVIETNNEKMIFTVSGSLAIYPEKATILEEIKRQNAVSVQVKMANDKIIVYWKNHPTGVINPIRNNDESDVAILKQMITSKSSVEGFAISTEATSYKIEVFKDEDTIKNLAKNELDAEKERIVSAGICSMEEMQEREDYARTVGMDDELILIAFKRIRSFPENIRWRIPKKPKRLFMDKEYIINDSVNYISIKKHLVFVGNKGTGKDCAVNTLAWFLNVPLYSSSSTNRNTDKMDVLGSKTIDAIETDNGNVIQKVVFQPETLLECMEVGGLYKFGEVNFAEPGVTAIFHSIMDDNRSIEVPGYRSVVADDNFTIVATMNEDYQGTNELNDAFNDRMEHMSFPDYKSIEQLLKEACPKAKAQYITICSNIYKKIKERIDANELANQCLTVRGFISALEASVHTPIKRALKRSVIDKVNDQNMREELQDIVNSLLP